MTARPVDSSKVSPAWSNDTDEIMSSKSSVLQWVSPTRKWVFYASNPFRRFWGLVMFVAVMYTATLMPYRLAFKQFKIPKAEPEPIGWIVVQRMVDTSFLIDLCLQFFFTYPDSKTGKEQDDNCKIACRYLKTDFTIDAIATFVPDIAELVMSSGSGAAAKGARLARLPRVIRLMRLSRLMQFRQVEEYLKKSTFSKYMTKIKGSRIVGYALGLLLCVHLFACGWYLCAALHDEEWTETWLDRREVDSSGTTVGNADSGTQWIHSMYFVLTVFTTVGFGDIGPMTNAEIIYVFFLMMIGAVVNSIIVSSMISILTGIDEASAAFVSKKQLIEAFAHHTKLDPEILGELRKWLHSRHKETSGFDSKSMRKLLLDAGGIPRELLGILPGALFEGAVVQNNFVKVCIEASARKVLPPRFALLVALELTEHRYKHHEIVYHAHDHAFNLFLVIQGTFAHVARPTKNGGEPEMLKEPVSVPLSTSGPKRAGASPGKSKSFIDYAFGKNLSLSRSTGSSSVSPVGRVCCLPSTNKLYPFQLFSSRAYCGDIELFTGKTRHSSLRNETTDEDDRPGEGVALVMSKRELQRLCEEFPQYNSLWDDEAKFRDGHRAVLLSKLTRALPYKTLAASLIQRLVRRYLQLKRRQESNLLDVTSCGSNDGQPLAPQRSHNSNLLKVMKTAKSANAGRSVGAKPDSESDLSALHQEVQSHGRQIEKLLEGIDSLLVQRKQACYSPSIDAKSSTS